MVYLSVVVPCKVVASVVVEERWRLWVGLRASGVCEGVEHAGGMRAVCSCRFVT